MYNHEVFQYYLLQSIFLATSGPLSFHYLGIYLRGMRMSLCLNENTIEVALHDNAILNDPYPNKEFIIQLYQ